MASNQTLFWRDDGVERSRQIVAPVLDRQRASVRGGDLVASAADNLIARARAAQAERPAWFPLLKTAESDPYSMRMAGPQDR